MARAARISRADFPTRSPARRVSNELFSIAMWPLSPGVEPQFSCVVSKKTAKKAVDRNKLKRRCREIASPLVASLKRPIAVIVYPKKTALTVPFEEAETSIASLLVKLSA